ncbi:hypothetical protein [Cellulomonas cellasea]|uniref:Uncharacterized protein n=1 Tax=Cellulomonas cellasea TaxID=43670 RepID=A0A4Y3L2K9_9CELL|nr:hypothetical protein [Cellulomonas cellasea]GEA89098.1 hypothetical protein CCE01nite_30470 [Cellulomonas cellasea]
MTQPRWTDDDELLADLRAALGRATPASARELEGARAAFTWRTVDAELATLSYDSLLDDRVLVRGAATAPRSLVFDAPDLTVELEVTGERLVGQLVPPGPGDVVLQTADGRESPVPADDAGCFSVAAPPGTRIRLRCTTPSATVVTDWVRT